MSKKKINSTDDFPRVSDVKEKGGTAEFDSEVEKMLAELDREMSEIRAKDDSDVGQMLAAAAVALSSTKAKTVPIKDRLSGEKKPNEVKLNEDKQAEDKQAEDKPTEAKPTEVKPSEVKPTEAKPTEVKPSEVKPTEAKPTETKPTETKPSEVKPTEAKPSETKPTENKSTEAKPTETKPTETKPSETKPTEAKPTETKHKNDNPFIKIVASLTVICAVTAGLLGEVNSLTAKKIADNTAKETESAIRSIFGEDSKSEKYDSFVSDDGTVIYLVYKNDALYGYCANVFPTGFGGTINMLVGVDADRTVVSSKIVAMSETPGLGSKTNTPDFLSRFTGKSGNLTVGGNIDAISGATISSKAVTSGVNTALSADIDLVKIAGEKGVPMFGDENFVPDTEPVTDTEAPAVTEAESEVTEPAAEPRVEDMVNYVDAIENVPPTPAGENPTVKVWVNTDTQVYITETETETETVTVTANP